MSDVAPTHLDLFSGVGGFALGASWAGFQTVAFCEIEPYCQAVLKARFGAVDADTDEPRCNNARQHGSGPPSLSSRSEQLGPELWTDIRQLDGTRYRGVDLLTAGVPCQPASCAGKQLGPKDDRWLWPEAIRILGEAKPTFAVFENPLGILALDGGMVFESLLVEMEGHGYEICPPIIIPACGVQADYYRYRVFVVAHLGSRKRSQRIYDGRTGWEWKSIQGIAPDALGDGCRQGDQDSRGAGEGVREAGERSGTGDSDSHAPDISCAGLPDPQSERQPSGSVAEFCRPETHFELLRGIPGLSRKLDRNRRARIHALGNSVVPAQVYPILREIRKLVTG